MEGNMKMNRLESISEGLSKRILETTSKKQKEIILKSCEYAISKSKLNIPFLIDVLDGFNNGKLQQIYKDNLENLVDEFENEYLKLQESEENDEYMEGEYLIPFGRARALSAVLYCFESDVALSSIEAVYEASMVTEDSTQLFKIIEDILHSENSL